jgi:hypothetical protein
MQLKGMGVFVVLGIFALPAVALAAPQFLAYEGRNAIHEGQGGNKKTLEGVDFWFNGDPPRRFKVIGAITDRRMETGIYGMIRMSGLEYDVAKAAKAANGDAVILEREGEDLLGVGGFDSAYATGNRNWASGFGSSFAAPIKAHLARYVVVAYLPDDPTAEVVPASPPPVTPSVAPAPPVPTTAPAVTVASVAPASPPASATVRAAASKSPRNACIRVVSDPSQNNC